MSLIISMLNSIIDT